MDGIDRIVDALNEAAEKLDGLAEALEASDGGLEEANAGKTAEKIGEEDASVAEITTPLVNALESICEILNTATAEVCKMTAEMLDDRREAKV
jgi:hypothetical protein